MKLENPLNSIIFLKNFKNCNEENKDKILSITNFRGWFDLFYYLAPGITPHKKKKETMTMFKGQ